MAANGHKNLLFFKKLAFLGGPSVEVKGHPWIPLASNTKYWRAMCVVSLITRWALNINWSLSLFLMSLALRLLFFVSWGFYFSLSYRSRILAAIKHRLEWRWSCSGLMHWLEGVIILWYQARAEIAGELELGICGHLCWASDRREFG